MSRQSSRRDAVGIGVMSALFLERLHARQAGLRAHRAAASARAVQTLRRPLPDRPLVIGDRCAALTSAPLG